MRTLLCAVSVMVAAGGAVADDSRFKPIDTDKLVVKPSQTAAALSAGTISLVGQTAANQIKNDGYVKTINNLFGFRRETVVPVQAGRSPLPVPGLFPSTQYASPLQPVMPTAMPRR